MSIFKFVRRGSSVADSQEYEPTVAQIGAFLNYVTTNIMEPQRVGPGEICADQKNHTDIARGTVAIAVLPPVEGTSLDEISMDGRVWQLANSIATLSREQLAESYPAIAPILEARVSHSLNTNRAAHPDIYDPANRGLRMSYVLNLLTMATRGDRASHWSEWSKVVKFSEVSL